MERSRGRAIRSWKGREGSAAVAWLGWCDAVLAGLEGSTLVGSVGRSAGWSTDRPVSPRLGTASRYEDQDGPASPEMTIPGIDWCVANRRPPSVQPDATGREVPACRYRCPYRRRRPSAGSGTPRAPRRRRAPAPPRRRSGRPVDLVEVDEVGVDVPRPAPAAEASAGKTVKATGSAIGRLTRPPHGARPCGLPVQPRRRAPVSVSQYSVMLSTMSLGSGRPGSSTKRADWRSCPVVVEHPGREPGGRIRQGVADRLRPRGRSRK